MQRERIPTCAQEPPAVAPLPPQLLPSAQRLRAQYTPPPLGTAPPSCPAGPPRTLPAQAQRPPAAAPQPRRPAACPHAPCQLAECSSEAAPRRCRTRSAARCRSGLLAAPTAASARSHTPLLCGPLPPAVTRSLTTRAGTRAHMLQDFNFILIELFLLGHILHVRYTEFIVPPIASPTRFTARR